MDTRPKNRRLWLRHLHLHNGACQSCVQPFPTHDRNRRRDPAPQSGLLSDPLHIGRNGALYAHFEIDRPYFESAYADFGNHPLRDAVYRPFTDDIRHQQRGQRMAQAYFEGVFLNILSFIII